MSATLATVQIGHAAVVIHVSADAASRDRLAARGILPGAMVVRVRGSDPLIVRVDDSRFAISSQEAGTISVAELATGSTPARSELAS